MLNDYVSLSEFNETNDYYIESNYLLKQSILINLIVSVLVIIFGLTGNFFIVYIFAQKRFRTNSSNVYLLCLGLNDALFLLIHFFESSLRTFQSITSSKVTNDFIKLINITDKFNFTCRLVNYLRYVLRFTSAYIIVAFTLQRLIIVSEPLQNRFKSKSTAWLSNFIIFFISILANCWVFFIFEIQTENDINYCDIKQNWRNEYFQITILYIVIIMLIPILIIFLCNFLTIIKSFKSDTNRKKLQSNCQLLIKRPLKISRTSNNELKLVTKRNDLNRRVTKKVTNSIRISKMLILISFSYVFFNLPYLIVWFISFYRTTFGIDDPIVKNYLLAYTRITETIQIVNYGINFYVYCLTGAVFRKQFKSSGIYRINSSFFVLFFNQKIFNF